MSTLPPDGSPDSTTLSLLQPCMWPRRSSQGVVAQGDLCWFMQSAM